VGVDIHAPQPPLPWLDEFCVADLCTSPDAFPAATFDLVLSSFTLEHFADPDAALKHIRGWLRPGGTLVVTTVNRRHPLVDAYLSMPGAARDPLQRVVKATAADAHPLVGACNTPRRVRDALEDAGFSAIEVRTTAHLARAWQRRLVTYGLGVLGDLSTQRFPERRSTIVARARAAGTEE
jgi:ubiquinone/menaquinone biosynthesis C-methylase UbiE